MKSQPQEPVLIVREPSMRGGSYISSRGHQVMNGGVSTTNQSTVASSYMDKERRSTVLPIVKRAEIRRASLNNHQIGDPTNKNKEHTNVIGPGISSLINEVLNEKAAKHHHMSPTPGPIIGVLSKKHSITSE
jgi:hypothetical protein